MNALHLIPHKSWNVHSSKNRRIAFLEKEEERKRKEEEEKRQHDRDIESLRVRAIGSESEALSVVSTVENGERKVGCTKKEGVPLSSSHVREKPWYMVAAPDPRMNEAGSVESSKKVGKKLERKRVEKKSIEEMRAERFDRESKEADRANRLLGRSLLLEPQGRKRYHAAYGYGSKRKRT